MGRFDGKVVLITGAGRGQGRSHAVTFAREGADVVALDVGVPIPGIPYELATSSDLEKTAALVEEHDRRALAVEADVRSQSAVDAAVGQALSEFGRIDVLVVNHGVASFGPFWKLTDEEWSAVLDTNLTGVWRVTKAVAPHMIERLSGVIVMTSSINAIESSVDVSHYNAAKAGVISFAKNVALELGQYGIRCNCVCPGGIDTPMINWQGAYDYLLHEGASREDLKDAMHHWTGLRGQNMLPPQVISDAIIWLASAEASSVTGIVLPVDAGHLNLPSFNHNPVRL